MGLLLGATCEEMLTVSQLYIVCQLATWGGACETVTVSGAHILS